MLQLERSRKPDRLASAFEKLQRAAAISQANADPNTNPNRKPDPNPDPNPDP